MNIIEVVQKANAFVFQKTGVTGDPNFVRLAERAGRPAWWVSYSAELFFPPNLSGNTIVDGGEYVVIVDVSSGDVSLLKV